MSNQQILRVSGSTEPKKLAGAIVKTLDEGTPVVLKAMGANSVNQAVKGIIVARQYISSSARDLKIVPGFEIQPNEAKGEVTVTVFHLSFQEN